MLGRFTISDHYRKPWITLSAQIAQQFIWYKIKCAYFVGKLVYIHDLQKWYRYHQAIWIENSYFSVDIKFLKIGRSRNVDFPH